MTRRQYNVQPQLTGETTKQSKTADDGCLGLLAAIAIPGSLLLILLACAYIVFIRSIGPKPTFVTSSQPNGINMYQMTGNQSFDATAVVIDNGAADANRTNAEAHSIWVVGDAVATKTVAQGHVYDATACQSDPTYCGPGYQYDEGDGGFGWFCGGGLFIILVFIVLAKR